MIIKIIKMPKGVLSPIPLFLLVVLTFFNPFEPCYAFHEAGSDNCQGCHVMHNSQDGQNQIEYDSSGAIALKELDASSTCLKCHAEYGKFYNVLSNDGSTHSAGGDFYWLKKTFSWSENGKLYISPGDNHGHNVVAVEYGLNRDNKLDSAPGGIYSSSKLGCTSCHDPHSRMVNDNQKVLIPTLYPLSNGLDLKSSIGNYRLLGGLGYNAGSEYSGVTFRYPAPVAAADAQNLTETDSHHPSYASGMSEWCANCHADFLTGKDMHPSGNQAQLSGAIALNYNSYVKTGDFTGTQATAYLALVPFESGVSNVGSLNTSSTSGPEFGANVMCLTCHRAHASAFQDSGRWDFGATFIANSHPKPGDAGASGNDWQNSYYGRDMVSEFGLYQRQFCNKCHVLD